jgi:hypothetical protein
MTGEEMERAIEFLLQSQATLEERNGSRERARERENKHRTSAHQ